MTNISPTNRARFFLGALLGLLSLSCASAPKEPAAPVDASSDEKAIAELLRAAELDGDLLDKRQRQLLLAELRRFPCPCDDNKVAAACGELAQCARGPFVTRAVARDIKGGLHSDKISARLFERFGPRPRETIVSDGIPCRGDADAPLQLMIFSDFECPACANVRGFVDALRDKAKDKLRVCYKHYPLSIHQHAKLAAQASVAAHAQGKFWDFHETLFENQDSLSREDLIGYAKEHKLDVAKFTVALDGASREVVARDVAEAARIGLRGTPSFILNGRPVVGVRSLGGMLDWFAEELAIARSASADKNEPRKNQK